MVHYDSNSIMPVGLYKGYALKNVPPQHLLWRLEKGFCFGALKEYIEENKIKLEQQMKIDMKNKFR